jgi:hypothetical protein
MVEWDETLFVYNVIYRGTVVSSTWSKDNANYILEQLLDREDGEGE